MFLLFTNEAWGNVHGYEARGLECASARVSFGQVSVAVSSVICRQHLDDCAESFLMAAFHNSQLFTMKANYWNKEKDLRIIRPLVYVRETETRKFAEGNKLPIIPENCPACFSEPKERNRMKQLLAQQEILHPNIFHSLRKEIV